MKQNYNECPYDTGKACGNCQRSNKCKVIGQHCDDRLAEMGDEC